MRKKWFACAILPTMVASFCIPSFVSCQDESFPKQVDGTDWGGYIAGQFLPEDYVVNDQNQSVTYVSGLNIQFENLIIPNYVIIGEKKYCVFLGMGCFQNCQDLISGSVEFNDFIDTIPSNCFTDDQLITSLKFHKYPLEIGGFAFNNCHVHHIYVNNNIDWTYKLRRIGDSAFEESRLVDPLVFGPDLEHIGTNAFINNFEMPLVSFMFSTKLKSLSEGMFKECRSLKTVSLHKNLTTIGADCFTGCEGLEKVILQNKGMNLTLGDFAFNACTSFTGFSTQCILKSIGRGCFLNNESLIEPLWNKDYGLKVVSNNAFEGIRVSTLTFYHDGVEDVLSNAFATNDNLMCLDFTDFKYPDVPTWTGTQIFSGAPQEGIILVDKNNVSNVGWQNLFAIDQDGNPRQGIRLDSRYWVIRGV